MANSNPKIPTKAQCSAGGKASAAVRKGKKIQAKKDWDDLRDFMVNAGADRVARYLNRQNVTDKEFMKTYLNILNYFKPKMQSAQIEQKGSITINITSEDKNDIDDI